ncbi:MAG: PD-(D/E)XK nuclease family protein [Bacteroidia bacterium]|nr:PD-(D/E)XK nuclease family protein [Bacteroidia bacterium]
MKPFLQQIAELFLNTSGYNISECCFVFPNRRAGLFFQKYLTENAKRTMLAPKIQTIADFFASYSTLKQEDKFGLLFRLYDAYKQVLPHNIAPEPFDDFIYFGEMILSDFNDVDNYMVNAEQLYTNIKDLKNLDNLDYLTSEQKEVLTSLLEFKEDKKNRAKFIETWNWMLPLYNKFREILFEHSLAYDGMLHREVIKQERLDTEYSKIIFVGFNALNEAEKALFKLLGTKADFYWDYKSTPILDKANMAHFFMEENISQFPSKLKLPEETLPEPTIKCIGIPSGVGQTKEVGRILSAMDSVSINTAVVLSDEQLLLPTIYSIPDCIENVNITMGYPINHTPIQQLLEDCLLLQKNLQNETFYFKNVLAVLNHPYILRNSPQISNIINNIVKENKIRIDVSELLNDDIEIYTLLFKKADNFISYLQDIIDYLANKDNADAWSHEFIIQASLNLKRIGILLNEWRLDLQIGTILHIIHQIFGKISIAFKGEPLGGLQIMGMLETRCLDFDNLIITSFNEGIFPKTETATSFIPYNLRRVFNLPTTEHQDAIFAYHFYRLIQRASSVYLIYDTRSESLGSTGEESRYIKQLKYLYNVNIQEHIIQYQVQVNKPKSICIEKNQDIQEILKKYLRSNSEPKTKEEEKNNYLSFSASSLNDYLKCPLSFYYSHILNIKEQDEVTETMEGNQFGQIFHKAMELIYTDNINREVNETTLNMWIKDEVKLRQIVQESFNECYFKGKSTKITGMNHLIEEVIIRYIKQILIYDKKKSPFTPLAGEELYEGYIYINELHSFARIYGYIDRIDDCKMTKQICDYKTGSDKLKYDSVESLFDKDNKDRNKAVLQIYIYIWLYLQKHTNDKNLSGHIYLLKELHNKDFSTEIQYTPNDLKEFVEKLKDCIIEILNPDIPFSQTTQESNCKYCCYSHICHKG